ncbi:MAG: hypothetical protein M1503_11560 [Thaumarchaeota archaeon]|nr:hypothetical protein [Nitrososphaerota archaeon]MCL5318880.1 hypothetical protein [Nitrososphaerota archaeon]
MNYKRPSAISNDPYNTEYVQLHLFTRTDGKEDSIRQYILQVNGYDKLEAINIIKTNGDAVTFLPDTEREKQDREIHKQVKALREKLLSALAILESMEIEG